MTGSSAIPHDSGTRRVAARTSEHRAGELPRPCARLREPRSDAAFMRGRAFDGSACRYSAAVGGEFRAASVAAEVVRDAVVDVRVPSGRGIDLHPAYRVSHWSLRSRLLRRRVCSALIQWRHFSLFTVVSVRARAYLFASIASMMRSWILGRKSRMAWLSRRGCTRLVSSEIEIARSGSIQIEVPVKPRWPTAVGEK